MADWVRKKSQSSHVGEKGEGNWLKTVSGKLIYWFLLPGNSVTRFPIVKQALSHHNRPDKDIKNEWIRYLNKLKLLFDKTHNQLWMGIILISFSYCFTAKYPKRKRGKKSERFLFVLALCIAWNKERKTPSNGCGNTNTLFFFSTKIHYKDVG